MSFYCLLLGHLIGDFSLQTDKIAENKVKSIKWNLFHSLIVTACIFLFSIPFGKQLMGLALLNGITHFFIDFFKSKLHAKNPFWDLIYFIADQALHIGFIILITAVSPKRSGTLPFSEDGVKLLTVMVLVGSFSSILIRYISRLLFRTGTSSFFLGNEKNAGRVTRIIVFFALYIIPYTRGLSLLAAAAVIVLNIIYYNKKWYEWMGPGYFSTKLVMDVTAALAGFFLSVNI